MANDNDFDNWIVNKRNSNSATCLSSKRFGHTQLSNYGLKTSRSGSEFRFINSAIYAESFNDDIEGHFTRSGKNIKVSCGDSILDSEVSRLCLEKNSARSENCAGDNALSSTYRCESPLVTSHLKPTRIERRCKIVENTNDEFPILEDQQREQRYISNGHKVVQISTSSTVSSVSGSSEKINGVPIFRQIAHEDWMREKQKEALRKKEEERHLKMKKKEEEEKLASEKEEKERQDRDIFLKWVERKKKEELAKQEAIEQESKLQQQLKKLEEEVSVVKIIHLKQWSRKKDEAMKAQKKKQQKEQKKVDKMKQKRLEESVQAYEKWREKSKMIPRPATQGLLPHQTAKPAFVNPEPWQGVADNKDDKCEESHKNNFNDERNLMTLNYSSSTIKLSTRNS